MPIVKVLLDKDGAVIGTAQVSDATGAGAPAQATLVARPGQRVVEVKLDDHVSRLNAEQLHAALGKENLAP